MGDKIMSGILTIVMFITHVFYGYYLLKFIAAPRYLWLLWIISYVFVILAAIASALEE